VHLILSINSALRSFLTNQVQFCCFFPWDRFFRKPYLFAFLCVVVVCRLIENWLKGAILGLIWPAQAWFLSILARSGINPIGGIQVV
jgi:hypothetical protein